MKTAEFLLEIGTEEIPDWMINNALKDLERLFRQSLEKHSLDTAVSYRTEGTPRRLVLVVENLAECQPERQETITGPPREVAFDDTGNPTKAGLGFVRRAGIDISELETNDDGRVSITRQIAGRLTSEILAEIIPEIIVSIHFPKTMYWTGKSGPRFIRPIRWLVALYNGIVIPFELAGITAGTVSYGHRRLASKKIEVSSFDDLRDKLQQSYVILSGDERRKKIESEILTLMPDQLRVRTNPRLLAILVNITEYPTPILGNFEKSYLTLPEEVLETVMEHHQKYFAVEDKDGCLQPKFVAVANLDNDSGDIVRQGNERVLRARFNDAQFFWDADQKRPLVNRAEDLRTVTFQAQLGSYFDKTERNQKIAVGLAQALSLPNEEIRHISRAVELAKCDLTTELVGEFPELQGVVGGLYAKHQGEPLEVADAIYDHYRPSGVKDEIPRSRIGQLAAIADKLDTLGGLFRLNMIPTGSKDPFALRRAAYGIIRILVEGNLALSLPELCAMASANENTAALEEFFVERLRYYLREVRGYRQDEIQAVLNASSQQPLEVVARAEAIAAVRSTEDFELIAVGFKRISNILRQIDNLDDFSARVIDEKLIEKGAEGVLFEQFRALSPRVASLKDSGHYQEALILIASLRPVVDSFFNDVMVLTEDEIVRNNRLTLLAQLKKEFSTIADFSEIVRSND